MKKVVMYVNQFYGGKGGEEMADYQPTISEGPVGPGLALQSLLENGEITHTVICGDSYIASNTEQALAEIGALLDGRSFDLFVAGPAFMSGRYGVSCANACNYVSQRYHVPVITCMYEENPGRDICEKEVYVMVGGKSGAAMRKDIPKIASLANKILNGREVLWADAEGYFPRGFRWQINLPEDQTSAKRAVAMLKKKLAGEPFETEMPITAEEKVPIAPPRDPAVHRLAFISTGGLVPMGNPDHIPASQSTRFGRYDLTGLDELRPGEWETVHGGYDHIYANADPMLCMPLDALRRLEKEGKIGYFHPFFYTLTGNQTNKANAVRLAKEIVEYLRADDIDTVIFGSA